MTSRFFLRVALLLAVSTPAIASSQSGRTSHVILATVDSLPSDGTVAVVKRSAGPRGKDIVYLDARRPSQKSVTMALAALRHHRFTTPVPARDVTLAIQGTQTTSASTPGMGSLSHKKGTRVHASVAALDLAQSRGRLKKLQDARLP